jgi:hypothetical protein
MTPREIRRLKRDAWSKTKASMRTGVHLGSEFSLLEYVLLEDYLDGKALTEIDTYILVRYVEKLEKRSR